MVKDKSRSDIKFYTNLIYFIVVVCFVCIRICAGFGLFKFMGDYGSYIMSLVTQIGLIFLLPFLLFKTLNKLSCKETFKFFSFKKVSIKTVLVSIFLGVIVFALNVYVSSFFNGVIQFFGYKPSTSGTSMPAEWWVLVLDLFCTAVLPAICEETLHRGMLLKGNSTLGMKKSIIISGFLFGLLHCNIEQFFYATIIGLFLGYLCWCCSSIYPCIIVHFMNNSISVFLSFAKAKGWAIGNIFTAISNFLIKNPVTGFIIFILCFILLLIIAGELVKFLIKDGFEYNFVAKQKELTTMFVRQSYFNDIEDIKNNTYSAPNMSETDKKVIYINANEFFDFVDKNMKEVFKKAEEIENAQIQKQKLDTKTKIFLWGSIALTAIITILTFIWGLL